ncbi:MAG: hypothetical protein ABR951_09405 [Candidatus Aminicenantales bacterium]|jgi:hypothetical protein
MTTKKMQCLVLFLAFIAPLAFSAEAPTVAFKAGDFYLSPQLLGVTAGSSGKIALGANAEYFLSKEIAVGGDASFYLQSPGGVSLFPDIEYHFNVNVRGLDVFAGAGPSLFFGFGTDGKTLFGGKAFGAARYFFTPSTGVFLKLGFASNKEGTAGLWAIGVSFKL